MGLFDKIRKRQFDKYVSQLTSPYDYCPKCAANIELQKGYSPDLPYWICKGCGEMLINPNIEDESNIVWICDKCGAYLTLQDGFNEEAGVWKCTECGHDNKIDKSEIYLTEDEFRVTMRDPNKGLSDEEVLALSLYSEEGSVGERDDILIVRSLVDNKLYIKKILGIYDESIYRYLLEHPVKHMPKVCAVFKGDNNLIVIEEYIEGKTLAELLKEGPFRTEKVVTIIRELSQIVKELHSLDRPIIHRDIKPSNVMVTGRDEVYLLDMNVAKWYDPDESEDTRLLGTLYYAAPEQLGYGFSASTEKSDIYAIGMLLNVMVTGKLPKEEKATGDIWSIIEKCIRLEPSERYSDDELLVALEGIEG